MLQRLMPHLHVILLCICWYIISSLASQVTKQILTVCSLPLFLGEFQFIYTAALATLSCYLSFYLPAFYNIFPVGTFPDYKNKRIRGSSFSNVITKPSKHIIETVLPLGIFQFVGKYFGHSATSMVPVSTVASIKTLSPLFILIFQKLLKISTLPIDKTLSFSLFSLVIGVWIIVQQDSINHKKKNLDGHSTWGIICAVISMFIFVGQNIYGKKVFTFKTSPADRFQLKHGLHREDSPLPIYNNGTFSDNNFVQEGDYDSDHSKRFKPINNNNKETMKKYDKMTLMIYISSIGFSLSFFWFITMEFPIIYHYIMNDVAHKSIQYIPWKLLFLNGTFHFIQAMITYHLLGEVSTLTYSIANLMKRIAIISVSWLFAGGPITILQIFGLLINTSGLFFYEQCSNKKKQVKSRIK